MHLLLDKIEKKTLLWLCMARKGTVVKALHLAPWICSQFQELEIRPDSPSTRASCGPLIWERSHPCACFTLHVKALGIISQMYLEGILYHEYRP